MRRLKYFLRLFYLGLFSIIFFLSLKSAIVYAAFWTARVSEKHIGKTAGFAFGWIIGLYVGGLIFWASKKWLYPYFEKIDAKMKTNKPFTEKYGSNYPQPKPEDFGITREEFQEYNSRFQFEFIKIILTYGLWFAAIICLFQANLSETQAFCLIVGSTAVAILNNYLFEHWNNKISQRHRYFEKINKFQQALRIHSKIRDENLDF